MNISDALRSGGRVLLDRPREILPLYLFELSVMVIIRVPVYLGGVILFWLVTRDGRLQRVIREIRRLSFGNFRDPSLERYRPLAHAIESLFTPTVVAVLVLTVVCAFVISIIAQSVAMAGTIHTVYAGLTDRRPVSAGISGIARDTLRMIGLQLIQGFLVLLPGVLFAVVLFTGQGVVQVALLFLIGFLWALWILVLAVLFLFTEQAIVIDDIGPLASVRRSAGFIRDRFVDVLVYIVLSVVASIGLVVFTFLTSGFGLSQFIMIVGALFITPFFDLVKTGLYTESITPLERTTDGFLHRTIAAFGTGLRRLGGFLIDHPLAMLLSAGFFIGGIAAGWMAVSGIEPIATPSHGIGSVFGPFPADMFVQLSANNWLVAAGTTFSGLAFAVPSITNLLFNGLIIGGVAGITAPTAFVVLVAPHGIIELPALILSGGVGLHLGRVGWSGIRGRRSADEIAGELERAYYIVLGLAPLFVIAAFIEAFLTPWIAEMVLS